MLFSIVIPAHNAGRSIEATLKSIDGQDFQDYEIIIVDDGSTDDTSLVIASYQRRFSKIKLIQQDNKGAYQARRTGVAESKGEYIIFVDADDSLRSDALSIIREALSKQRVDMVSFCYTRNKTFSKDYLINPELAPGFYDEEKLLLVKEQVARGHLNSMWAKAISRTIFQSTIDASAGRRVAFGEDLLQMLGIMDICQSVLQIDDVLYYYNDGSPSGVTASFKHSQLVDIDYVTKQMVLYAREWGTECLTLALCGRAEQFLYLMQLNELSKSPSCDKRRNAVDICTYLREGLVVRDTPIFKMRFDYAIVMLLIEVKAYPLARVIIRLRNSLKSIASHNGNCDKENN